MGKILHSVQNDRREGEILRFAQNDGGRVKRFFASLRMTGRRGTFRPCHSEERSDEESVFPRFGDWGKILHFAQNDRRERGRFFT